MQGYPHLNYNTLAGFRLHREIAPGAAVEVIANGVDVDYFAPSDAASSGPPAIVFTGDMSYFPNEDAVVGFARQVFPLVRKEIPNARFCG